ncbi:hypothetical protein B0J17DRAFT_148490 [Rhizoctonia solani]|nr:hypothetical protein B0J17DRAFT_148490 [Rhizoctonia solani]
MVWRSLVRAVYLTILLEVSNPQHHSPQAGKAWKTWRAWRHGMTGCSQKHIVTCAKNGRDVWNCSTRLDSNSRILSREIRCVKDGFPWELFPYCTKHIIYYKKNCIPKWKEQNPVWTRELSSLSGGDQGGLLSESRKPFGMYRHEIRVYRDLPGLARRVSMLVWKSSRD